MITIINAIQSLRPTSEWVLNGDSYDGLIWIETNIDSKPTEAEVMAEIARLQAEYEANQYQRDRAKAYPSIQEQLDMLWHSVNNGTDLKDSDWFNQLSSVKQAHPKGQ